MTRSGASFVLAVEDRGGMGPCPPVHLNVSGPQWLAISSHARPHRCLTGGRAIATNLTAVLSCAEINSRNDSVERPTILRHSGPFG